MPKDTRRVGAGAKHGTQICVTLPSGLLPHDHLGPQPNNHAPSFPPQVLVR